MPTSSDPARPLRRDAERNRQRIVDAATKLFAARGLAITHEEIARAADVGIGTVYRRFPDKDELITALFRERVEEAVAVAERAAAAEDPWDGLVALLSGNLELQARDRGLRELLQGSTHGAPLARSVRERIAPVVDGLLARAIAEGQVREGVRAGDLVMAQMMVGTILDTAREVDPRLWRRALAFVLDGLRPGTEPPSPLPGRAPGPKKMDALLGAWRPPQP